MDALLDDLECLAREKSRERRGELLRRLTDLFFRGAVAEGGDVVTLFEDVICRVLEEVDQRARADLSGRMALAPVAPRKIVVALANDEIPVAAPVLRHSPVLTDADLIAIAERRGAAHAAAMSRRVFVSEAVTDALIARGSAEVRRALAGNDGAQISGEGYRTLLEGAAGDHVLQELMVLRTQLPDAVRRDLLPMLAAEVRRRVITRLSKDTETLIERALDAEMTAIVDRVDDLSRDRTAYVDLQVAFDEGVLTLDEAILEACRQDRHDWVVDLLAFAGPLERARILSAMLERDPKPVAVIMKCQGLGADTFRAVLDLRAKLLKVGSNAPALVEDYAKLDPDVAQTVLRHLRARLARTA